MLQCFPQDHVVDHFTVIECHQMTGFRTELKPGALELHSFFIKISFHCYIERLAPDPVHDGWQRDQLGVSTFDTETKTSHMSETPAKIIILTATTPTRVNEYLY